jgi:hypothetical protein
MVTKNRRERRRFEQLCRKYGTTTATIENRADDECDLELVRISSQDKLVLALARLRPRRRLTAEYVPIDNLLYIAVYLGKLSRGRRYWYRQLPGGTNGELRFAKGWWHGRSAVVDPRSLGIDDTRSLTALTERILLRSSKSPMPALAT